MKVHTSRGSLAGQEYTEAWVDIESTGPDSHSTTRVCVSVPGWDDKRAIWELYWRLENSKTAVRQELERIHRESTE